MNENEITREQMDLPGEDAAPEQTPEPAEEPTEDAATSDYGDYSTAAEPEEEEVAKPPKGVQKRIDELVKAREDAKRDRDYWRDLAIKTHGEPETEGTKRAEPEAEASKPQGKPNPADFESDEDYIEAIADWKYESKRQEDDRKRQEADSKVKLDEKRQQAIKTVEQARERYSDYDTVVTRDLPVSVPMADAMLESPHGPDIAYYLGKNRDESRRIANLPPVKAIIEIGRIAERIEAAKGGELETTKAPAPVRPLGGGGEAPVKDPSKLPMKEWVRLRDAGKIR